MQQNSVRRVTQERCTADLVRAKDLFGVIRDDGSIPIVLCPRKRFFLSPFITVPTGVTAILGRPKDMGDVPAGTRFAMPWVRCYYMVPNQACTYNYDVVGAPTRDNVMVDVDITFVFRITDARAFCLKLGAQKANEMMQAVCEEAIRSLVRDINHKEVYELRGSGADHLLNNLNHRFSEFGLLFVNATITNVLLPDEVATALQRITALDQKMKEHIKSHEFEQKKLNDKYDLYLADLRLKNDRSKAQLNAEKQRLRIELETKQTEAEKHKEISVIQVSQGQSVALREAEAEIENEKVRLETYKEKCIKTAEVEARKNLIEAEYWGKNKMIESEAHLVQAKNKADIITLESEAESKASSRLKEMRNHELDLKSQEVLESLASKNTMLVGGNEGTRILSTLLGNQELLTTK